MDYEDVMEEKIDVTMLKFLVPLGKAGKMDFDRGRIINGYSNHGIGSNQDFSNSKSIEVSISIIVYVYTRLKNPLLPPKLP